MIDVLLVLLISHLIGDFYFQSQSMAKIQKTRFLDTLVHSALYALSVLMLVAFEFSLNLLLLALGYAVLHLAIDAVQFMVQKHWPELVHGGIIFIADQLLHLAGLGTLAAIFAESAPQPFFIQLISLAGLSFEQFAGLVLLFLIIFKPVNITHQLLFGHLKPRTEGVVSQNPKTGATIGNLERLLVTVFLLVGQYTAIGLVLTGKSIARYKKITDDQSFAEYYLIGTFYSLLSAVISFLIIKQLTAV